MYPLVRFAVIAFPSPGRDGVDGGTADGVLAGAVGFWRGFGDEFRAGWVIVPVGVITVRPPPDFFGAAGTSLLNGEPAPRAALASWAASGFTLSPSGRLRVR